VEKIFPTPQKKEEERKGAPTKNSLTQYMYYVGTTKYVLPGIQIKHEIEEYNVYC
jgi:hypothetical protein